MSEKINDIINGKIRAGIIIEPSVNKSLTTDGIKYANNNEIIEMTINPSRINGTIYSLFSFSDFIRHRISLPKVIALIKLKESIVDMMIEKIPIKKNPRNPTGKKSIANSGYVRRG